LTTKFTQHTQSASRFRLSPSARNESNAPLKLYGPLNVAHRALNAYHVYAHQQLLSGTHKNLRRLVFTQSIQLSNIVLISLLVCSETDLPRLCRYGPYLFQSVQTPEFLQPNVRRQNNFH